MRLPSRTERFERDVQRARALVSHHDDGLVSGSGSGLGVWREAVRSLLSVIDGMVRASLPDYCSRTWEAEQLDWIGTRPE